ncbi:hypothetical protein UPYG_G00147720 [Umbra pygmaea]|uniref:Uncharacterized protein n=1 Tax=Umbra pygmaea TaxID=75934 RepID=A0ABD0WWK2_UMBPY
MCASVKRWSHTNSNKNVSNKSKRNKKVDKWMSLFGVTILPSFSQSSIRLYEFSQTLIRLREFAEGC